MKNLRAQISIAVVCCLLGFMLTYQFKLVNKRQEGTGTKKTDPEIVIEIEQLKKEKKDMESKINDLQYKLKQYETEVVGRDDATKKLKEELDNSRNFLGETDLEGEGIIVYITPRSDFFNVGFDNFPINDRDILYIINELYAGGAEAISVNDIRITSNTGIRNAGNAIRIDNDKISPVKRVVIKAIGDKAALESAVTFPDSIPVGLNESCDIKWNVEKSVSIKKTNKIFKFKYANTVKGK
ncbi:DUF881 domain-containing protein [Haloimpatiens lingqiaonensis]|uniref:DUF881 domain-containing protein n=1 Tax=Haloimpatiens lingqiaonensis TaxID=1380675 RepID=UPI0010FD6D62|nr:DUF881 domain-containing protein [Haloimpatiens lingqiaonensis]